MRHKEYCKVGLIVLILISVCYLRYVNKHQISAKDARPMKQTVSGNPIRNRPQPVWNQESEFFSNGTLPRVDPSEIAILMAFDTKQSHYLPRSVDDKREYAEFHGYKFLQDGVYDLNKPPVWGKISSLRKYMRQYPKIKWFWWIDLDTLIIDPYYTLEDHILGGTRHPRFADKDVVISYDCNGFNAGSFMIRNSAWSREFLTRLYDPIYDDRFGYQEQGVMQHLFQTDPSVAEHFYIVPQRQFNSFPKFACQGLEDHIFHEGDFLVHLAGCWAYGGDDNCRVVFEQYWSRRIQIIPEEL